MALGKSQDVESNNHTRRGKASMRESDGPDGRLGVLAVKVGVQESDVIRQCNWQTLLKLPQLVFLPGACTR